MTTFRDTDTVGHIVRDHPAISRLFEQVQVDYCCGGQRTLAAACAQRGIDVQSFLAQLEDFATTDPSPDLDLTALSLTELADHIERIHHAYLHEELPRLEKLVTKVAKVHSDKEPRLAEIKDLVLAMAAHLTTHLMKEEQVLFPLIRQIELSATLPVSHCGSVANPIQRMELEHDEAGQALAQLRQLTDDYTSPVWACNTYRTLFDALYTFGNCSTGLTGTGE
ncbi:iron-sulfur cluster repair di-iron protein [Nodosilinea sp. E11]|uniref:iron-sulfur cluster repair di-iron protein n=1 Tax=Nodosilinea sp. E11 TaxID=3037479 RepID=UPI0029352A93|nr:iron-sulfur cluster repair di-iron protein [Nodosilinea sp. E11]WOD37011.1 iron-sulfur cluster repair di-iron protein [Nodosilinea sp. E11]